MTELILIRHGETDWNRELRFQGHLDVPLNATGLEQARRLAQRLRQETVNGMISSDLLRARQTAELVAQERSPNLSRNLLLDRGLREQCFGLVEGMRVAEIKAQHAQAWAEWVRFDADYAFEGGETTRSFHARVLSTIQKLAIQFPQGRLAVFTHGGVLDMIYRTAMGIPLSGPRQSEIPNAGLNRIRLHGSQLEILDWADTTHLAGLPEQAVYDQTQLVQKVAR